ncbi:hypothetical protein HYFRA_00009949 [Hymenoscyphus fraxineus]|uniref:methylated diphthine methylhydrolase n=1 Tax=Hymenoscyphus fraxineus TaxID=746836 RepID=A0A9N9L7X8_9HELO|nr:hypothetical protein HYFRA_00009949 [Hymenoscyphus fraxineus]
MASSDHIYKVDDYSKNIQRRCSEILDLPPSCIEFVPREKSSTTDPTDSDNYFIVGTYHLQASASIEPIEVPTDEDNDDDEEPSSLPKPQERNGSLNLFNLRENKLTLVERIPYPAGILDFHFIPHRQIFAVASSTGCISFYRTTSSPAGEKDLGKTIKHMTTHQIFPPDILVLSLTWVPTTKESQIPMLVTTINTGEVHLIKFSNWEFEGYEILNDEMPIYRHDAEAWIAAVCPSLKHVYTGGDDIQLQIMEANLKEINEDPAVEAEFTSSVKVRGHDAGITAILPLPFLENRMFLTGSYDDTIRLYTISPGRPARLLYDFKLGGGVWRLKFLEEHSLAKEAEGALKWRILASCMHAGAKILELDFDGDQSWKITEVGYVKEHKSMNYASDVQPLMPSCGNDGQLDSVKERLVVSTSFYDKLLVVWTYDPQFSI